jgi:hypothetical protein
MSIDLFQGEIDEFVCDIVVVLGSGAKESYQQRIKEAPMFEVRHIAVTPRAVEMDPSAAMLALRELRDGSDEMARKRITFVLPDAKLYKDFQTALFNCFSDDQ